MKYLKKLLLLFQIAPVRSRYMTLSLHLASARRRRTPQWVIDELQEQYREVDQEYTRLLKMIYED